MNIKYKSNRLYQFCFASFLSAFMLLMSTGTATAQITGGNVKPEKEKKEKKEKEEKVKPEKAPFNPDNLAGNTLYWTGLGMYGFRNFEDQSPYNVHAQKNDETPLFTGGTNLGIIFPIAGNFSLDIGLTFFGHGEQYDYDDPDTDSSFHYSNSYLQVGIPLKLRYTYGNDFQVFGFAGMTPLNILNIRNKSNYTTAEGTAFENDIRSLDDEFTAFNFMFSAGVGVNYYVKRFGLTLYPEYRRHLSNTYSNDTFKRVHKMYGFALNFGVLLRL